MGKLYRRAEIERLNLPGYQEPATIRAALDDTADWDPVLNATIVSYGKDGKPNVLTGIRREETHRTHPGVVSTPTMRLPKPAARDILASRFANKTRYPSFVVDEVDPLKTTVVSKLEVTNAELVPNGHSTLPYVFGSLLSQKLGAGRAVEEATEEDPIGTVSLASITAGFSFAATERKRDREVPLFEPLIMMGAVVFLRDRDIVPPETPSYRNISWITEDEYEAGLAERRADVLVPGISADDLAQVCVRGMCLATTNEAVKLGVETHADATFLLGVA